MQEKQPGLPADINSRLQSIMQRLCAPLNACSDAAVYRACIMQTDKAVAAIEQLFQDPDFAGVPAWEGRQQVASMYAAGPRRPQLPVEALRVLLQEQPALLKPLAGSCTDGHNMAMQQAPAMVLHVPDDLSSSRVQDDADASFLPLVHARMIGATEFKVVDGMKCPDEVVSNLTAAYDKAARIHGACFARVHTFRMEGRSFGHPVMPSLAAYLPNLQQVYLTTMEPDANLARFICALRGLQHLRVLRISVHASSDMNYLKEATDIVNIALPALERLELGFQLCEHTHLPPGLKQLVGGQWDVGSKRGLDGGAVPKTLRLRLHPSMAESLRGLTEARMCMLEMPVATQPTAQQLKVMQALDSSCALLLVHTGAPVAPAVPAAVTAAVTAGYVWLESPDHVHDVLRLLSGMLPRLTDLWVLTACNAAGVWHAVLRALQAGTVKPACLHAAGRGCWGAEWDALKGWYRSAKGVRLDISGWVTFSGGKYVEDRA
jgi:hypothetical protein